MYLNPVLRYDGTHLTAAAATVDVLGTWILRGCLLLAAAAFALLFLKRRAKLSDSIGAEVVPHESRKTA
jgi:hypothetical protein